MGLHGEIRSRGIIALIGLAFMSTGTAADFSFTGSFSEDDQMQEFTLHVTATSTVIIRTWSYAGGTNAAGQVIPRGGFDPYISVFDSAGNLISENDDGTGFVATNPVTGAAFDSYLSLVLTPGTYTVVLTQSGNVPVSLMLSDGFTEQGNSDFTESYGCGNPMFCDITPDSRTPFWALDIDNVTYAAPACDAFCRFYKWGYYFYSFVPRQAPGYNSGRRRVCGWSL